jgi:hypothetical protein
MKEDTQKPNVSLLPVTPLITAAKCLTFGAKKYGQNNWKKDLHNVAYSRTYSSIQRHLMAYWDGVDFDEETGLSHLAHAMSQIMILLEQTKHCPEMDDRFKYPEKKEV